MASHGAGVAIGYLSDPDAARRMADALVAFGRRAVSVRMDVTVEDEVVAAFARARAELGAIDIVVSNAGREAEHPLVEMTLEDWGDVIGTNLTGTFLVCREGAQELAPHGIRVAAVAPGAIATPINAQLLDDPAALAQVEGQVPMGRIGRVEEVARAAVWLASGAASYVTGATLVVDGGMALYPPDSG